MLFRSFLRMKIKWYQAKVVHGERRGKQLGFPTLNLDNPHLLKGSKEGVYAAKVIIEDKIYGGLIYFGPRLIWSETENVLEIFVLDFDREIYGKTISFQVIKYLRGVINFPNSQAFKGQLNLDIAKAKEHLEGDRMGSFRVKEMI